jgi:hypothetical protein
MATPNRLRQGARMLAAKRGQALPDGSFPIRNRAELSDAIQALGRAEGSGAREAPHHQTCACAGRGEHAPRVVGREEVRMT